jgi:uncharacterized protein (TIGR00290 family)
MSNAPTNTWLSWSSGKDSAWALHVLRNDPKHELTGLFTTVNSAADRVAMHAVRRQLLVRQAEATGLPLHVVEIPYPCSNEQYAAAMTALLDQAKAAGVGAMAFGDLFLEDIRSYRETMLAGTGVEPVFPLWGRDTSELSQEMVSAGLRAHLTCVDPKALPESFAGRSYDSELLADLPDGVDPCGENGEFHTFVHAGPMLSAPLAVKLGEVVHRDGFVFADILPVEEDRSSAHVHHR